MASVTLTTLRARVRERADMANSGFITDSATSLDAWINEGCQHLHELLVESFAEEYISTRSTFTTAQGTNQNNTYALPEDFFKLYGVTLTSGGVDRVLKPYMRSERGIYRDPRFIPNRLPRYSLVGGSIQLLPLPQDGLTGTILYAPVFQAEGSNDVLVDPNDTCNFPNGWEKYVVLYAAVQALLKEESDTTGLERQMAKIEFDIKEAKAQRDAANPKQAVDIEMADNEWDFRRGWT